ncbi:MAG: hypothetical protein NZL83_02935 [Candidatus Absconditabacterales bacterium]|nr:hypothetical protein [Candidatus Absconditabacterales bacterium]
MNLSSLHRLDQHCHTLASLTGQMIYIVGGCVRDLLIGHTTMLEDIDATCACDPHQLYHRLRKHQLPGFFWTEKFGTLSFRSTDNATTYEITPMRCETGYDDARHPTHVTRTSRLLDDAVRRDFSVNCLYYTTFESPLTLLPDEVDDSPCRIEEGVLILTDHAQIDAFTSDPYNFCYINHLTGTIRVLIDPYAGLECISPLRLACVGNPLDRLYEDSLRIIRALRFVSIFAFQTSKGCDIHKETWTALKQTFHLVPHIAKERIHNEILKVLDQGSMFCFVSLCDELNILKYLFPSLYACKNIHQPVRYHPFDVYAHTLLCLHAADVRSLDPYAKLALVFHDVGKVDQYYAYGIVGDKNEASKIPARNHRNTSSVLARPDLERLGFSRKEIDRVCRYIDHHHDAEQILASKESKHHLKLKKLLTDCGEAQMVINLWRLSQCDRIGQYNMLQRDTYKELDYLVTLTENIVKQEGIHHRKDLAINGHDLLARGYQAGPELGQLLDQCFHYALEDWHTRNTQEALFAYCDQLTKKKTNTMSQTSTSSENNEKKPV